MLGYEQHWYDPYNRNTIKADAPIHDDWFFNLTVISDTFYEVPALRACTLLLLCCRCC